MFYKVDVNGEVYYTNIKTKKSALAIAKSQAEHGNNVVAFRVYPETDRQPGHTEIIFYYIVKFPEIKKAVT